MSDYRPDSLRALVAHGKGTPAEYIVKRADIDAHADAWEAQAVESENYWYMEAVKVRKQLVADNAALRERLEAAEGELSKARSLRGTVGRMGNPPIIILEDEDALASQPPEHVDFPEADLSRNLAAKRGKG